MIARYAGAGLGLFAFAVTVIAGLAVRNPITVTLSRSILALFLFLLIGAVLGRAAQAVLAEYVKSCESRIQQIKEAGDSDAASTEASTDSDKPAPSRA